MCFLVLLLQFSVACAPTTDPDTDSSFHGSRKQQPLPPCVISISCMPSLPELFTTGYAPPGVVAIHWLRALMLGWRLRYCVTSSYLAMSVWCNTMEFCFFPTTVRSERRMMPSLPMNEPLRSGNRPKPQQWKPDESTEVEETSAGKDQDWNDDSDADWTFDSESRSSLPGGRVCAIVACDGRVSSRRSNSETDSLISDEEASQNLHVLAGGLGWRHWLVQSSCG